MEHVPATSSSAKQQGFSCKQHLQMFKQYTLPSSSSATPVSSSSSQYGYYWNHNNPNLRGTWATVAEREHMFDKVVTPSDVGKLNRLVIPKQHAEKYFPLHSSTDLDNGLVLNFEDCNGKAWRFRYSYWNSSQSYVMTKGWRRFVKDKKLDAGDIVSFLRSKDGASFFIDWRRCPNHPLPDHRSFSFHRSTSVPWTPLITYPRDHQQPQYWTNYSYGNVLDHQHHKETLLGTSYLHKEEEICRGDVDPLMVLDSVPVVEAGAGKKLRLFGVNMEME